MITHLACVMDGNRRWATKQGKFSWLGHQAGAQTVQMVINFCLQYQIAYLSLYTFSLENFNRSQQEKSYLFDMIIQQADSYIPQFIEQGVCVHFVGKISLFPESVQALCKKVEEKTKHGTRLQVNFLFGYGARQEIFDAAQRLVEQAQAGMLITQNLFESNLWTGEMPDPDLIIRTGGVQRMSNFLLYQAAYTEIRFVDTLWPDLTKAELMNVLMSAISAQKNLGK